MSKISNESHWFPMIIHQLLPMVNGCMMDTDDDNDDDDDCFSMCSKELQYVDNKKSKLDSWNENMPITLAMNLPLQWYSKGKH